MNTKGAQSLSFVIGWLLGDTLDRDLTTREATELFPHWTQEQHTAFCQGSIDGHAKDLFRFEKAKLALEL